MRKEPNRMKSVGRTNSKENFYWRLIIVSIVATSSTHATECPFLTRLGKSSDDTTGDLWSVVAGGNSKTFFARTERDLRRYHHYKSGSGYKYEHNRNKHANVYTSLSDIWLCLACAVGWTVWLVSATRAKSTVEPSVFEAQESRKIIGNVLQVTLGEDPDGTGIPVYHTLVDYVVESDEVDDEPLQVRKCFATGKLLEEGFANVEVLVLVEDPTTSILMDDFLLDQNERTQKQMEPPDMIYTIVVYMIAAVLIITSLVGGLHAYFRLDPEQEFWGKISLGVGTVLIYPLALLLYLILSVGYRWATPLIQRPGIIVHGAHRYWSRKCGGTLNPLEVMGTFDGDNYVASASPTSGNRRTSPKYKRRTTSLSSVLELSQVTISSNEGSDKKQFVPRSPRYPNAGCGLGNFNVLVRTPKEKKDDATGGLDLTTRSISSVSSGGTGGTNNTHAKSNQKVMTRERDETVSLQMPDVNEPALGMPSSLAGGAALPIRPSRRIESGYGRYVPPQMPPLISPILSPGMQSSAPTPQASNLDKLKATQRGGKSEKREEATTNIDQASTIVP